MVDLVQIRADLEGQREDIDRIDTTGFKVISRLSDSVAQLETGVDRLGKGLNDHRADLRGNQDDLASLKTEMRQSSAAVDAKLNMLSVALKAEIRTAAASAAKNARQDAIEFSTELRADLAAAQDDLRQTRRELEEIRACMSSNAGLREYTAEVAAVRKQVVDLGKDVEQLRKAIVDRKEPSSSAFLSRELDILASNLAKIGNRASQVETLQMELDILKGRVERMEGSWQDGEGDDSRTIARQSQDSLRNARLSGRKRSLPNLGNADRFDVRGAATASSSKRQALSSETDQPCPSSPAADEAIQVADTRENANASDKQRPSRGEGGLRKKPQRRGPRKSGPF
jgi:chromosome segregation ATPase